MTLLDEVTPTCAFRVLGDPSPQGGTKSVPIRTKSGKTIYRKVTEGGVNLKSWRTDLSDAARAQAKIHGMFDGPLALDVLLRFHMAQSAPKWAKAQGVLPKATIPDSDKLVRAVGDALKVGGLVKDDARFAIVRVCKIDVWESWVGALVAVRRVEPRFFRPALDAFGADVDTVFG